MIEYRVEVDSDRTAWYNLEGQLHREDGPAMEYANGDKEWYKNGEYHREDGPALEYINGNTFWYKNGEYHREDGPALEWANGDKEWWLNGKNVTEQEFLKRTQTTELTLDQIAEKFGCSVDKLKIKK